MSLAGKRILYISYNGMLDPLGQSQVIPYLKELSKEGIRFVILSFERSAAFTRAGAEQVNELERELLQYNIEWRRLPYHKTPSLPATAFDVMQGVRKAKQIVRDKQIELIHARSHIPALIALRAKKASNLKMIFDVRGLLADEYVDAEHWRRNSVSYRLTKSLERRALTAADGIVTLTERIWPVLHDANGLRGRFVFHEVVPCCADLKAFRFDSTNRAQRRAELGIEDRFVMVYSGSIDGWYLTEEMANFFSVMRQQMPRAHFLWLTKTWHDRIQSLMRARGVPAKDFTIRSVASHEVGSYLSASDVGLAFIKPCFSKLASSPTKFAEYLGCGLPLIINSGIGDSDNLITQERAGILVREFTEAEYLRASAAVEEVASDASRVQRMRTIAERLFDVTTVGAPRYARLYEQVLGSKN